MKDFLKRFKAHSVAARVLFCLVCIACCVSLTVTVVFAWYSMTIGSGSNILQIDTWTTESTTESTEETNDIAQQGNTVPVQRPDHTEATTEPTTAGTEETTEATTEPTQPETTEATVPENTVSETTVATVDETVSE